jgi:iron complex outermembrane receptor protein
MRPATEKKAQRPSNVPRVTVRLAVLTALAAAAAAQAQEAATTASDQSLQEVTVTGSRIRRVDTETANPVLTVDPALIQQSGAQTVGDLIMMLPTMAGQGTNPATNDGGGFGESYLELRGLDAKRTLILLDGRRIGLIGDPGSLTTAVDVNQIPLAIIDHVEILKEGAGAVYGSDAIAGVVNFITRKDVQGAEITADYGRTTADDGAHHQVSVTFGNHTDKFDFMISGREEQDDSVLQGRRDYSKYALYNSSSSIYRGGSSRTPTGRIYLPSGSALATEFGCDSVTKISGSPGTTLADYRCFNASGPNDDHYNYAPLNYLETPQDRASIFSNINYKINDDVSAYGSVLYNRTHSGFQEASLPFDSVDDNIVVSQYSMYNPFGISFGGNSGANTEALWRLLGLGPRQSDTVTDTAEGSFGLKGNLLSTGWTWDVFSQYGELNQSAHRTGYFFANGLAAALGPSMLVGGTPTCVSTPGDPATPIAGCTPIDIFTVNDPASTTPAQQAAFSAISADYYTINTYRTRSLAADVQGKVFSLPAGDALLDVGTEYRWQEGQFEASSIVLGQPPYFITCQISQEACTGDERGHESDTDFYAELFVPLLKDLPGAQSLNLDVGTRFSDYPQFGNTTRSTIKIEYKPIKDLLVRGTYAQVFRAPTILDIAAAPRNNSANFTDPCNGLTTAKLAATPGLANACVGVPTDGSFQEADSQITGVLLNNPDVKPETGDVITGGFVYEPSYVPGISLNVDYWTYTINSVIEQLDPNYSIEQCIATGLASYCDLVNRFPAGSASAGQILLFNQPTVNLGTLKTDGVDIGALYQLRDTPLGNFKLDTEVTHVMSYTDEVTGVTTQYAGTYSRQYGNDTQWRGLSSMEWSWQGFEALLTEQFINRLIIPDGATGPNRVPDSAATTVKIPSIWYTNLSFGYTYAPSNTHVEIGMQNVFNRQPPIFYQNNVLNANTDVATYDVLGRRWFVGFTQKF